ncbi:hypothetical protein [Dysgonomonas termitidis]|uniref:Uncharacterized protein n=1 Tax=Dysgonomonas termitidis TaxID=1516126 RepID=A0ABV9KQB6_9BACT
MTIENFLLWCTIAFISFLCSLPKIKNKDDTFLHLLFSILLPPIALIYFASSLIKNSLSPEISISEKKQIKLLEYYTPLINELKKEYQSMIIIQNAGDYIRFGEENEKEFSCFILKEMEYYYDVTWEFKKDQKVIHSLAWLFRKTMNINNIMIDISNKIRVTKLIETERQQFILKKDSTMTVAEFKERAKTSKLNIHKSPKTGALFMTNDAGNAIGGASSKFETAEGIANPVVSLVAKPDAPEDWFYLLHDSDLYK